MAESYRQIFGCFLGAGLGVPGFEQAASGVIWRKGADNCLSPATDSENRYLVVDRSVGQYGAIADDDAGGQNETASRRLRKNGEARDGRERYVQMLALQGFTEQDLLARGLDDAHAWLPPR